MERNRTLHVAICTDGVFPHAMGGMQRHSGLLIRHLAALPDLRISVLHPHQQRLFADLPNVEEISLVGIDPKRFYLRELWRYSARVAEVLDRIAPDVIYAQGFSVWQGAARFSKRCIVNPHGLEMFQGLTWKDKATGLPFRLGLRWIVRRSGHVVSLGGKLTPILARLAQGSPCRVVTLPNAVEVPATAPERPAHNGPLRILFVGRFATNKGLDLLVAVARRFVAEGRAGELRFLLAGDGPLRPVLEQEGVPANVELLGRVDDARLVELYRTSDALVLPTRFEGMPTVVLEAMAQALPVIVSDVGASAELVDMHNGHLLPPGDVEALYAAFVDLLERPASVRRAMGLYGHRRAQEHFTWPVVAGAHAELFREVANGN